MHNVCVCVCQSQNDTQIRRVAESSVPVSNLSTRNFDFDLH